MPGPRDLPRPSLVSYPPGVPPTYEYPQVPLTRFLEDAARDFPDLAATWFERATISYSGLLEHVDRLAAALADLGVQPGTPVGLVLPNLPAAPIALFASLRLAAVVVPIHPTASSEELHHQLEDSGCELVVCVAPVLPRIEAGQARLPRLRSIITTHEADWLSFPKSKLVAFRRRRLRRPRHPLSEAEVLRLTDLLRGAAPTAKQAHTAPDDIALIAYSKGTESPSRGIAHSHANLVANAFQARLWIADTQAGKERVLLGLPAADLHGLVVGLLNGMLSAATLLLLPRFDVEAALKIIAQQRPTLVSGVPAMYASLVEHASGGSMDLSSIRVGVSNGPLSGAVVGRFQALSGGRLRESYGPSGTSALTHANPVYGRAVEGRIGLPVTDTVSAVVDAADPARLLPAGQAGRLAVSGPQVAGGNWNQPEDTGAVLRDGWLVTRDLAVADEDGYYALLQSGPVRNRPSSPNPGEGRQLRMEDHAENSTEDLR
ncbi:MAG: AMP-binding protein [Actinomycetota bacterium]|nr:AMP-binding protein [Actinomycetota bacterium]